MGVTPLIPGMISQGTPLNNRETGAIILQHTQAQVHARAYRQPFRFPANTVAVDDEVVIGTLDVLSYGWGSRWCQV
jgi:hypothetical protein